MTSIKLITITPSNWESQCRKPINTHRCPSFLSIILQFIRGSLLFRLIPRHIQYFQTKETERHLHAALQRGLGNAGKSSMEKRIGPDGHQTKRFFGKIRRSWVLLSLQDNPGIRVDRCLVSCIHLEESRDLHRWRPLVGLLTKSV